MDFYSHDNYKEIIKLKTRERREQLGQRFSLARVATACGVQKTYLSKVLNTGSAHLNADQLTAACEFLNCTEDETDYCLLLRDLATVLHAKRRQRLQNRMEALLNSVRKTKSWLKGAEAVREPEVAWTYYTDVYLQLVHLFLTIPAYQKNLALIETALGLPRARVTAYILKLEHLGLVTFDGKRHLAVDFNVHLDAESPIYRPCRSLQRIKSLEKIEAMTSGDPCYAMTAAFAAERQSYEEIKMLFLELIKKSQAVVLAAKAEHVFQMNIDFFQWD